MTDPRRDLPSVNALLESAGVRSLLEQHPRRVVLEAVRNAVSAARNEGHAQRTEQQWLASIASAIQSLSQPSLRRVINATGVVLHTNLGRAPLAESAVEAITHIAAGFSNLEYDVETGERGSRHSHCVGLLRQLTGAEDALVVNNCAAAMVLTLNALAQRKEVLVSRGELVEIGGSFRIPDIMARAGAKLVEVGTTNRTHDDDYRRAITPRTAAIVKVHRSNFAIEGFTSEVSVDRLAFIAAEHGLPVIHDLGSGLMVSLDEYGLTGEPTASMALESGASLLLMSGDKLLGGPQAGIILGAANVIAKLRKNPFARAMRVDKLTLSALEATLRLYLEPERAIREIPVLSMLTAPVKDIEARAEAVAAKLRAVGIDVNVASSSASVGGGAFPTAAIPSRAIVLSRNAQEAEKRLRLGEPAVIGRISERSLLLDLRSVLPREDDLLAEAIMKLRHDKP
jgi:L-seryl-tRNA(Ser) seleniumtransferase